MQLIQDALASMASVVLWHKSVSFLYFFTILVGMSGGGDHTTDTALSTDTSKC